MERFFAPKTRNQLVRCLAEKKQNGKMFLLAGGTDLAIKLREGRVFDYTLIDLSGLDEARRIEESEEELLIGAAVTMSELADNEVVRTYARALAQAAHIMGSTQIRNTATIGGNVASASQSADTLPPLFAYEATCTILNSGGGVRSEKVEDLVVGLGKTLLARDEAILAFHIPKFQGGSAFVKIAARRAVAISKLNCCVKARCGAGALQNAVVYFGAIGPKPIRAKRVEAALDAGMGSAGTVDAALAREIRDEIEHAIPQRVSKHYKKEAAIGILEDALQSLQQ